MKPDRAGPPRRPNVTNVLVKILFGLLIVLSVNVLVIAITGGYRIDLGPIHQTAYGLYKPMLLV